MLRTRWEVFREKVVLANFGNFFGKQLRRNLLILTRQLTSRESVKP